jgi:hypothetical protein
VRPTCDATSWCHQKRDYPFFGSEQGGEWANPTPDLEYLNGAQNIGQGGRYGNFAVSCHMKTGTPPPPGVEHNSVGGDPFISIPLRKADLLISGYLCNGH